MANRRSNIGSEDKQLQDQYLENHKKALEKMKEITDKILASGEMSTDSRESDTFRNLDRTLQQQYEENHRMAMDAVEHLIAQVADNIEDRQTRDQRPAPTGRRPERESELWHAMGDRGPGDTISENHQKAWDAVRDVVSKGVAPTAEGMRKQLEAIKQLPEDALDIGRGNLALGQAVADGVKGVPDALANRPENTGGGMIDPNARQQLQTFLDTPEEERSKAIPRSQQTEASSNKTGRIETEDGEVMYQFTPQLFSKFLNDYSQTLMQTQEQQIQTGHQENDPLFDMIRGNNNQ